MNPHRRILLIDLDGVLNEYDGKFDENIIPNAKNGTKEFLEKLSKDYDIKIFTTRNRLITSKWLIKNNIDKFIKDVTNVKESSYLHIDDRCICFDGDFEKAINAINNFKVYWK